MPRVRRDAKWVQREYGSEKWPAIKALIADALDTEHGSGRVSRTLAKVSRQEHAAFSAVALADVVAEGQAVRMPGFAAVAAYQALITETLISQCGANTELIIELGSGWGRNLVRLWLDGGPATARYVAAEFTKAGREATELLAAAAEEFRLTATPFDYRSPRLDLGASARRSAHALVFSAHSIEQIPQVTPGLLDVMRSTAYRVTCVHFEPVGWQTTTPNRRGSSREYAEHHDYNRNLLEVLRAAERDGQLCVDTLRTEVIGVNPENATSVVVWSASQPR